MLESAALLPKRAPKGAELDLAMGLAVLTPGFGVQNCPVDAWLALLVAEVLSWLL